MALVCICIPTRNRAGYVRQAIQSVLRQTYSDFRLLVSDDASGAETAAAVRAYVTSLSDPRVSYCYHDGNLREFAHGRFLIRQCNEEFFSILHDDDIWEDTFLERCIDVLVNNESLAVAFSNEHIIDAEDSIQTAMTRQWWNALGRDRYSEGRLPMLEPFLFYEFFLLSATVFRTSVLKNCSLLTATYQGNSGFDVDVFFALAERNHVAYYIREPLLRRRVHAGSLTAMWDTGFNREVLENLMAIFERRTFAGKLERQRKKRLSSLYHNYAIMCYFSNDFRRMYRYLAKCLCANPWRWKNWAYAILGFLFPFFIKPVFRSRVIL